MHQGHLQLAHCFISLYFVCKNNLVGTSGCSFMIFFIWLAFVDTHNYC